MSASFNAVAHTWDEDPRRVAVAAAIGAKMLGALNLTQQTTLLDYGAGTGLVSLALAPHVGRLIAVDEADAMLDILRAKLADAAPGNVEVRHWSAGQDSSGFPPLDVITGSMVLHHVEDIPAAAAVFHGLLRPGGVLRSRTWTWTTGAFTARRCTRSIRVSTGTGCAQCSSRPDSHRSLSRRLIR